MKPISYYLTDETTTTSAFVSSYKQYAEGSLKGKWLDLSTFDDAEEFQEVVSAITGEKEPETMFQDFQGVPRELAHESMDKERLDILLGFARLDADKKKMVSAFLECVDWNNDWKDLDDVLGEASDRCVGAGYDEFSDFSDERAEEEIEMVERAAEEAPSRDKEMAEHAATLLRQYFDFDAWRRGMEYDYYFREGYVFIRNY